MKRIKVLLFSLIFLGTVRISSAATTAIMDLDHWTSVTDPGNTSIVTQEADGIKFTAGVYDGTPTTWRHGAALAYNMVGDFRTSVSKYKFMANGGGWFMDANVGLFAEPLVLPPVRDMGIFSRYTTGNPFYSYQINENQWYYSMLTVTPDRKYTYVLSTNGYASDPGASVLDTLTRELSQEAYNRLETAHMSLFIGDTRNWMANQWMKIGEASTNIPVPEPASMLLLGSGLLGMLGLNKRKNKD
ncbi:MAG: PEP-CTERM sorting domain-containing protein [Candidatus Schekmanbacteria bacterium]|nr:PEP-CTERM sorting domain-containing protein [Candidatus Schekmanbacteria bacterium]